MGRGAVILLGMKLGRLGKRRSKHARDIAGPMLDNISDSLKEWREERGYSQEQAAIQIGIAQGHVSRIEAGLAYPGLDTLVAIARTTKLPLSELLLGRRPTREMVAVVAPRPPSKLRRARALRRPS